MISILILLPVILGILALIFKNKLFTRTALLFTPAVYIITIILQLNNLSFFILPEWISKYFFFDSIGLFFLTIMSIIFAASAVYSLFYFKEHNLNNEREAVFTSTLLFFIAAMSGVLLASHLALLWVFVEATTLSSALLIYFEKKKSSLEAAWKYVYICSIGIALAFVGIIIMSIGSKSIGSLFFSDLYNNAIKINPLWLQISFAFIFIGFGTKVGIAPIHAWLPDAHSEAPSPVSALLSATLLNSALLGLIRVQEILIKAGLRSYSDFLFMVTGFFSLFISAVFLVQIKNYKRMLAYSSIENMGILFIGLSLGAPGIFAAMIHTAAHSLSKASLFLTSGNILNLYGTKQIGSVQGLLKRDKKTGWLWITSMLSISGLPPFPSFISKFLIIKAFFIAGKGWLSVPFFLLIVVVLFGLAGSVFRMSFLSSTENEKALAQEETLSFYAYAPQVVLLLLLLLIGITIPENILLFLKNAAAFLG